MNSRRLVEPCEEFMVILIPSETCRYLYLAAAGLLGGTR